MALTFPCCPSVTSIHYIWGAIKTGGSVTRGRGLGWIVSANVEVGKNGEKESVKECKGPGAKIIQEGDREWLGGGWIMVARLAVYRNGLTARMSQELRFVKEMAMGAKRTPALSWFPQGVGGSYGILTKESQALVKARKRNKCSEKEVKVCGICWWQTKHPKGCSDVWEACKGCMIGTRLGYKEEINI